MADRFEKTNTPGVRVRMVDGEEYLGPGKKWLADWRDHAGRRRTRTFRTKKEAIDHREAVRADARRITAGHAAPPPDARLFEELSDHWLQIKAHKKSIRDDRSMINKHRRCCMARDRPGIGLQRRDSQPRIASDSGIPSSVIRLRMFTPIIASVLCASGERDRSRSPMMCLNRYIPLSARAC